MKTYLPNVVFCKNRIAYLVLVDVLIVLVSVCLALVLQFGDISSIWAQHREWLFVLAPLLASPVFFLFGLYRAVLRYVSYQSFVSITEAVVFHAVSLTFVVSMIDFGALPITLFVVYLLVLLVLMGGSRVAIREIFRRLEARHVNSINVAIYGAGSAGVELSKALQSGVDYLPVLFVDDKHELQGDIINGLKVYPTGKLEKLIKKYNIRQVLLSIPSAPPSRRKEVMKYLSTLSVQVKTVPDLLDIISGRANVENLQDIRIEDILGRTPVPPNMELLSQCITGKTVMVTGAGGSIGSELCRQIVQLNPSAIVLFEISEYALYSIEKELQTICKTSVNTVASIPIVPVLGSVLDKLRLQTVMRTFAVDTLYHAAAYKHVPMVEFNPVEGIKNNIFGTFTAATVAAQEGVQTFILISTDKAVRPTNVMGATKRLSELLIQGLAERAETTSFSIVRFGNVLDSSGSVVPLFKQQIKNGGPITLTHPDMTRYFMTIPEAAQLVLQAGAMGEGGDVFVLDMGAPVHIKDLANSMISLSGHSVKDEMHPYGDICIETTAMRPGEKLYEELLLGDNVSKTKHPRIMRAHEAGLPWMDLMQITTKLDQACQNYNIELALQTLREGIEGYAPQCGIEDKVWQFSQQSKPPSLQRNSIINHRSAEFA